MPLCNLIIDWTQMHTYNTSMAIGAGAGLCTLATALKSASGSKISPTGYAMTFGILGLLLFSTGLHMTLTWPLAKYFPFDNIVFGEPCLCIGLILLGLAWYFNKRESIIQSSSDPLQLIATDIYPLRFFLYGIGIGQIGIGVAGVVFKLFAAPPEEPISGWFAAYPMLETIMISSLFAMSGVAALLTPMVLKKHSNAEQKAFKGVDLLAYRIMMFCGSVWIIFGGLNFFTHIGLIVNTTK